MATFIGTDLGEFIRPGFISPSVVTTPQLVFPSNEADVIDGGGGNDVIDAGGGNDIVVGGLGDDLIMLGPGNDIFRSLFGHRRDTVHGGTGIDRLEYFCTGTTRISLTFSGVGVFLGPFDAAILNGFEVFSLTCASSISSIEIDDISELGLSRIELNIGSASPILSFGTASVSHVALQETASQILITGLGADIVIERVAAAPSLMRFLTSSGDDVIDLSQPQSSLTCEALAGAGNDLIISGRGGGTLSGADGIDGISYARSDAAVTVGLAAGLASGGFAQGDVLSGFENVLGSRFNDALTGNAGANQLTGGRGEDALNGADGNDILIGGADRDALSGGLGADRMRGGEGGDLYFVENLGDIVIETATAAGVDIVFSSISYTLGTGQEILLLQGTDPLNGTGNGVRNQINGTGGANVLHGAGGNDILLGLAGNDRMTGGFGDDRLSGGAGFDQLNGGIGRDDFQFGTPFLLPDVDRIMDFSPTDDTISLQGAIFGNIPVGALAADAFANGTVAQDAEDRVIYDTATGRLFIDVDGLGGDPALLFARVTAGTELTNLDFRGF